MKKIFVNICSYRDPLLIATIDSLIKNASGRNFITYGIFEQNHKDESLEKKHPHILKYKNVSYKRIDPEYPDGVVWARSINSMQVFDEEFYYQIDSHMLFDKDWDHFLVLDYNQAKRIGETEKIVLTTGTKNFSLDKNKIIKHTFDREITTKFGYFNFDKDLILKVHGTWINATDTVLPSIHAIAGNFFTVTKWIDDVGYKPKLYFEAEEQIMSLDSILADYKIYAQRKIKCYHYMDSIIHSSRQEVNPVIDAEKIAKNIERERKFLIDYIYSLEESDLEKYKKITGVDYINRKIAKPSISQLKSSLNPGKHDWEESKEEN